MPKHSSIQKLPQDLKQQADSVSEPGEEERCELSPRADGKDPAAVSLGRRGGLKGGPARAKKLTKKQRSEIARRAAFARWGKPSR